MQPKSLDAGVLEPFIGVVTPKGVAYETKSVATGLGAMLLNQLVETNTRAFEYKLSQKEALDLLRKCMELSLYRDCTADSEFDLTSINADDGTVMLDPEIIVGNWDVADASGHYE